MKNITVPGIVWAAILIISTWAVVTFFPDQPWAASLILAANGILKFLEVTYKEDYPDLPTASPREAHPLDAKPESHKVRRFFID